MATLGLLALVGMSIKKSLDATLVREFAKAIQSYQKF